uniref:G_PROTEIN_RECEP_F1_2 domain-containing protein n=1 Tax=Ascaris lumbricoides TaxID=6252 RepID=A0A0M3IUJ4_ASCLU
MMLVMWLVLSIISAVGNLLSVITAGIWIDHLSKMKTRTGLVNGLSCMMLLASVAVDAFIIFQQLKQLQFPTDYYSAINSLIIVGVCYILTSVLVCHFWVSNSPKYQAVGKISVSFHSNMFFPEDFQRLCTFCYAFLSNAIVSTKAMLW